MSVGISSLYKASFVQREVACRQARRRDCPTVIAPSAFCVSKLKHSNLVSFVIPRTFMSVGISSDWSLLCVRWQSQSRLSADIEYQIFINPNTIL